MSQVTVWLLAIFFGIYSINQTYLFYIKRKANSVSGVIVWFVSYVIFAFLLGALLERV